MRNISGRITNPTANLSYEEILLSNVWKRLEEIIAIRIYLVWASCSSHHDEITSIAYLPSIRPVFLEENVVRSSLEIPDEQLIITKC